MELQSKVYASQNHLIKEFYDEMRAKRIKTKEMKVRRELFVK